MESLRTHGIVLRLYKLTETSLIVVWLTRDCGKLKTVAKGARRPKSPMRGRLDLFFCDELQFLRSRKSELHILQEVELIEPFARIRTDVAAFNTASYFVALTDAMTELEHPVPELFALLGQFLGALERGVASRALAFAFEFRLLRTLGMDSPLEKLALPQGTRALLHRLTSDDLPQLTRLKLSPAQATQLNALATDLFSPYLRAWPLARAGATLER